MYLMIDNYDSFVYNLRAYFEEAGAAGVGRDHDLALHVDFLEVEVEVTGGDHHLPGTENTEGCGHFSRGDPKVCR